jgi:hypothetical protein
MSVTNAITVLTVQCAREAVKRRLYTQGVRWRDVEYQDLVAATRDYLEAHHAELVAEAKAIIERRSRNSMTGKQPFFGQSRS